MSGWFVPPGMMNRMFRTVRSTACAVALVAAATSCTTTYDYYGRPVQTVDPVAATVGIAAAGLIGYALADDNHHGGGCHGGGYYGGGYYGGGYYGGGYYGGGCGY